MHPLHGFSVRLLKLRAVPHSEQHVVLAGMDHEVVLNIILDMASMLVGRPAHPASQGAAESRPVHSEHAADPAPAFSEAAFQRLLCHEDPEVP